MNVSHRTLHRPKPDFGPRAAMPRPPSAGRIADSGRMGPPLEHSQGPIIAGAQALASQSCCSIPWLGSRSQSLLQQKQLCARNFQTAFVDCEALPSQVRLRQQSTAQCAA
eukprot:symbB.v1.2.039150.t1/scaffold6373.1/size18637/2